MTMRFPADVEASIRQKVESGRFGTETDVVRAALQLLDAREQRLHQLRASIAEGFAAIERGEGIELTPEVMEEIDREADEMVRLGQEPDPDVRP
jgi:antitoxin ParD1/3/4